MASMDNIEGDALEIGVLIAAVIVAYLVWEAYHGSTDTLRKLLRKFWNWIDSLFGGVVGSLSNAAHPADTSAQFAAADGATAYAGTNGTSSQGVIVPGYQFNNLGQLLSGTIGG